MEEWVEHLAELVGTELAVTQEIPPYCTPLIDDCVIWYQLGMVELISYNKTRWINDHFCQIVFNVGDWRITIYRSEDGWKDSSYKLVPGQSSEFKGMAMALYKTMLNRLKETNYRRKQSGLSEWEGIGWWMCDQLKSRGLEYQYKSLMDFETWP